MKKIIFSAAVALIMSGAAIVGYAYHQQSQIDPMILENIEALSEDEGGNGCPDFNYVPHRYIEAQMSVGTYTCHRKRELSVGEHTLKGSFDIGSTYSVAYQIKNCTGQQINACCDQRLVGITRVS